MRNSTIEKLKSIAARVVAKVVGVDDAPEAVRRTELMLAATAASAPPKKVKGSKYKPHQGEREMARRFRQMNRWMDV